MATYTCKGVIRDIKVCDDLISIACEDGWMYLFEGKKLQWAKKVTATYYRGPFTDTNVISTYVTDKYVAFGTDFADGKVYLLNTDGEVLWYRQFITIVGCWQRPEDVSAIAIGKDVVAGTGWINSYIRRLDLKGKLIADKEIKGDIKSIFVKDSTVAVGTTKRLYVNDREIKLPVNKVVVDDRVYAAGKSNVFAIENDIVWSFKALKPVFDVSKDYLVVGSNKTTVLSKNGEVVCEIDVPKPEIVKIIDDEVFLGYNNEIKVYRLCEYERSKKVQGIPVHIGEITVSVGKDKKTIEIT